MTNATIIVKNVVFGGIDESPDARTAVVSFDVYSDGVGAVEFNIEVVPEPGDPPGTDGAIMIARRNLLEFGKALAAAAEIYEPPTIYALKD